MDRDGQDKAGQYSLLALLPFLQLPVSIEKSFH
jgi:hypothetical protein